MIRTMNGPGSTSELPKTPNKEASEADTISEAAAGIADVPELEERNRRIYSQKREGMTQSQLARAYGLSPEWIRRICEDQERKSHASDIVRARMGEGRDEEKTELYLLIVDQNAFGASSGKMSGTPVQAYHCVARKWKRDGNAGYPDIDYFRQLTEDEISAIPGAGRAIEAFLNRVRDQMAEAR